ncbi:uncharacterized protein HKW66_Vig0225110 [Vigna angularis]|uniref:Aminotransferase-like plant mobile domain-containing protein n=1 Tax=Phaseolus angularis TaxID=3914 RepID=A0A8T0JZ21_PHAAN|nr:uncharacterized protein HKW66_Vig0225110 [Vigna angularis]
MAAKPPQLAAQPLNYQVEGRVSWRFTLFCVRGVVSVQFRLLLSCRMASSGDDCPMTKLSVRHSFSTKYICTLNERLTDEHRSLIVRTPFAWFLDVNVNVKVGISEILFPKRSGKVFPVMFNVVDNLSGLGNYCWGSVVYRFLLRSLCKASEGLKKGKGISNVYVDGCVYMLQVVDDVYGGPSTKDKEEYRPTPKRRDAKQR